MDIDFALWGFILGAVGVVLSSILTAQQIIERIRAKSGERIGKITELLQGIYGPIRDFAGSPTPETAGRLVESVRKTMNQILGLEPTFRKISPELARDLTEFIQVIRMMTDGQFQADLPMEIEIAGNSQVRKLISTLSKDIENWLSDHT